MLPLVLYISSFVKYLHVLYLALILLYYLHSVIKLHTSKICIVFKSWTCIVWTRWERGGTFAYVNISESSEDLMKESHFWWESESSWSFWEEIGSSQILSFYKMVIHVFSYPSSIELGILGFFCLLAPLFFLLLSWSSLLDAIPVDK